MVAFFVCVEDDPLGFYGMEVSQDFLFPQIETPKKQKQLRKQRRRVICGQEMQRKRMTVQLPVSEMAK